VDAYRLGAAAEIDDIDLDATTDDAVTVVEWGDGVAEQLSESWLHVRIGVKDAESDAPEDGTRVVTVRPHGPRWVEVPLRSTLLPPLR